MRLYPSLNSETDRNDTHYPTLSAEAGSVFAKLGSAGAYFEPELLGLDAATLEAFFAQEPGLEKYRHYLSTLAERKPHVRSADIEALLAEAGEALSTPDRVHSAVDADLRFRDLEQGRGEVPGRAVAL